MASKFRSPIKPAFRAACLLALVPLAACGGSELVRKFDGIASEQCGCSDAACAKEVHGKFTAAWSEMKSADIDWSSDQGKRDTKGIEAATKKYQGCLGEHISADDATAVCQEDDSAKKDSDGCTACCESEGRFFNSWVDPMAAGLASALGGGDIKGCTCK